MNVSRLALAGLMLGAASARAAPPADPPARQEPAAPARAKPARPKTAAETKTAPKHAPDKAGAPAAGHAATHPAPAKSPPPHAARHGAAHPAEKPAKPAAPAPAPPAAPAAPAEPAKGSATGLPLPRFAALRSDEVNFRAGPGTRYPIDWVYKRRELPVEIQREFEVWRLVADPDGVKGWVHQATLTGRRSFIVSGAERAMHEAPREDARVTAHLKPGVVGRLLHCDAGSDWCRVQVGEYRGWMQRRGFWGTFEGEAVN